MSSISTTRWRRDHIVRGPPDAAYPGLPGPITAVLGLYENVGNLSTSGIDVSIGGPLRRIPAAGTFRFSLNGTLRPTRGNSRHPACRRWISWAPARLSPCRTGGITQRSPGSAARGGRASRNSSSPGTPTRISSRPPRDVGTYSLWNLQGVYTGFRDWSIAAGVRNLLDTAPPFSNQVPLRPGRATTPPTPTRGGAPIYLRASYAFR